MGGTQANLPLCQRWHLVLRTSGGISALAQTSFQQPQIASWHGGVVATPPTLAPHDESEWCHLCVGPGELATTTDWHFLAFLWSSSSSLSDFSRATLLFWSSTWHGRMVPTPPILAPRAENKRRHLCDSLGETATKTDWHSNVFLMVVEFECF